MARNQSLKANRFTVNRNRALSREQIHYFPKEKRVVIERQKSTLSSLLLGLHLRHGIGHPGIASNVWGIILDLVIIAMLFWVVSGVWMWIEIKPARLWGGISGAVGVGLFMLFLFTI